MKYPGIAKMFLQEVAETSAIVNLSITQEVCLAYSFRRLHALVYCLYDIGNIYEGYLLWTLPHREIRVTHYALCHEEVILLPRPVDTRGTQYGKWQVRL